MSRIGQGMFRGRGKPRRTVAVCSSALVLAVLGTGCTLAPGRDDWTAAATFIEPDKTTRDDLVERFGPPQQTWEGGRIASWRVTYENGGELRRGDPSPFAPEQYVWTWVGLGAAETGALVVVFGADGAVSRSNLVLR
jgi:hypothetical protein